MGDIRMDPRKQFSKKLARWTAVFWFAYMAWLSVLLLLAPASALYAVYLGVIATIVMMISVVSYTRNSIQEKLILAMLNKTKLELSLKNGNGDDTDEEVTEGESNG